MKRYKLILTLLGISLCVSIFLIFHYIQRYIRSPEPIVPSNLFSEPVWKFDTQDKVTSTPVALGNIVFVRLSDSVVALNASTGNMIWKIESPSDTPLSISPQVSGNYLIVPEKNSRIAAFSPDIGKLLWRTPEFDNPLDTPSLESIAIINNKVIVARFDWSLAAYNIANGELAWEIKLSGRSSLFLASEGNTVYLGTSSSLRAYDTDNGNLLWEKKLDAFIGGLLVNNKTMYIIDNAKPGVIALDLGTRDVIWSTNFEDVNEFDIRCIRAYNNQLYISSEKILVISILDGQILWKTENLGHLECPIVLGNSLYVRNINTTLFAFDLLNGEEKGRMTVQFNAPDEFSPNRSPAAADGLLIVPVSDHEIISYQP